MPAMQDLPCVADGFIDVVEDASQTTIPCQYFVSNTVAEERQTRVLLKLLAADIPVAVVRTGDPLKTLNGRGAGDRTVLGYFGDAVELLPASAGDGIVFCAGEADHHFSLAAETKRCGWKLLDVLCPLTATQESMPVAGLRVAFEFPTIEDSRLRGLHDKLREAGALIGLTDGVVPDVTLCGETTMLYCQQPAIGINLAGPEEDPLSVWIQAHALSNARLPILVNALEAVTATPLNQWRRWMC